jgi:hypothetical protein
MIVPEAGSALGELPAADVHPSGTFKYILAKVGLTLTVTLDSHAHESPHWPQVSHNGASKNVVRASRHFDLHVDNFEALRRETAGMDGVRVTMLGGGRITHDSVNVNVYGARLLALLHAGELLRSCLLCRLLGDLWEMPDMQPNRSQDTGAP